MTHFTLVSDVGWALAPPWVGQKTGREEVKQGTPTETPYYHHLKVIMQGYLCWGPLLHLFYLRHPLKQDLDPYKLAVIEYIRVEISYSITTFMLNPGSFSHKFATFMVNSGASAINTVLLESDAIYSNSYFHAKFWKLKPQR
ncbi:MAG: hypothetical protein EZS28_031158 [Streblomastix strix]|uniref:Uncharacterized protein n=1 Tax=Streblomastix strix TaxID=222440 RepID=A0A5J4URK6_9EUKA|nr:MAG: hypothetical protein EZS28_031158 [Streblomastix strix]